MKIKTNFSNKNLEIILFPINYEKELNDINKKHIAEIIDNSLDVCKKFLIFY